MALNKSSRKVTKDQAYLSIDSKMPLTNPPKRKNESIDNTPNEGSIESASATSSRTLSHGPSDITPTAATKKAKKVKSLEDTPSALPIPARPVIRQSKKSPEFCGICRKEDRDSGERRSDSLMLQCDIDTCQSWYHLSCIQWGRTRRPILLSLTTGAKRFDFICSDCFGGQERVYTNEASRAFKCLKNTIESIKKRACQAPIESVEAKPPEYLSSSKYDQSMKGQTFPSFGSDISGMIEFELAREEMFQGFEQERIESILQDINTAIYTYDREVCWAKKLFSDGSDDYMEFPLKVWNLIDPGYYLGEGGEWFRLDDCTRNLSMGHHHPITAALRHLLSTPAHQPLCFMPELAKLSLSEVHTGLINWFVIDLLSNQRNIYDLPNMKPMVAMMSAVANFGDARWEQKGRQVLREIQLRAWHKEQFNQEVVHNKVLQADLIKRLEEFLKPLTRNISNIHPWSPTRASILEHTISLWSYLQAVCGEMELIHPAIGSIFDASLHKESNEELGPRKKDPNPRKILWILRRGFRIKEDISPGYLRVMTDKAIVLTY